ncbi:MAG: HAD family hydrolase [Syntrophotaleaceae bacterium]
MRELSKTLRSVVFDLDGTLYVNQELSREIERVACELVALGRGLDTVQGCRLVRSTRAQMTEQSGNEPALSLVCAELGIALPEFHQALQDRVCPERYLENDATLRHLLGALAERYRLFIYTNNSYPLVQKILALLGVEHLFNHLYTIEFCWRPKPDSEALEQVLNHIGGPPESFLFVGDRQHIDLLPPAERGIATLLVQQVADLLQLHKLLGLLH